MTISEQAIASVPAEGLQPNHGAAVRCATDQPISIYEVHLPSWMRGAPDQGRPLNPSELASKLAEYLNFLNFTHVQIQPAGFADPHALRFLVDHLHQQGLGVILDAQASRANASELAQFGPDGEYADAETILSDYHYKWDLAWAEETCGYFATDPLYRKFRQAQFRRRESYAFDNHYVLPLSPTVPNHLRPPLWTLMPGDTWQKFANLRLLFAYLYCLPGKKLLFMGEEFGQQNAWRPEGSLDWHLPKETFNRDLMRWVGNLNRFYRGERSLHQTDSNGQGFEWIDTSNAAASIVAFLRKDTTAKEVLLVVLNCTPVPRHNYRVGVPRGGFWNEVLNSDAGEFSGSGQGNLGGVEAAPLGWNNQSHSLILTLPPLGAIVLRAPLDGRES